MLRLGFATLLAAILLQACTMAKTTDTTQESRYPQAQDAAPVKTIAPEDVVDAIPRADPILAVGNKSPYTVNHVTYEILEDYRSYSERGTASWYGSKFHGHETSNGEIFDLYQASAAHKTLPIPSYAKVTNLDNGRSVIVRVNDRGPFHSDRVIDLSYGAAVKLGYMEKGTASVEVTVVDVTGVDDRRDAPSGHYRYLQLGAYGSQASAAQLQAALAGILDAPVFISEVDANGGRLYRVRVGPVDNADAMSRVQQSLAQAGYSSGQLLP